MKRANKTKLTLKTDGEPSTKPQIIPVQSPMHFLVPSVCEEKEDTVKSTKADDGSKKIQTVLKHLIAVLDGIQSICVLEVKVKYGPLRVLVIKSAGAEKQLLRCRVVCDITCGKVRVKLHIPILVAMSMLPTQLRTTVAAVNRTLNRLIPAGDSALISLVSSYVLKLIMFEDNSLPNQISDEEKSLKVSSLLASLVCLNITIALTRDIKVTLRRKEMFSYIKKYKVDIETRKTMQSFTEPRSRNIFQRRKLSFSITKLNEWLWMSREQSVSLQVFKLISNLDYYCDS